MHTAHTNQAVLCINFFNPQLLFAHFWPNTAGKGWHSTTSRVQNRHTHPHIQTHFYTQYKAIHFDYKKYLLNF